MDKELKQNLQQKSTWMRAFYMVLFAIIFGVIEVVLTATVLFQFISALLTGNTNDRLLKLGQSLSTYLYQIALFLTFNSEDHPYPFGAWPKGGPTTAKKRASRPTKINPVIKQESSNAKESEDETA